MTIFSSCTPYTGEYAPVTSPASPGVYHRVERGETLWSISRRYSIPVRDLARSNRISDASQLEVGQKLWIPAVRKPVSIPSHPEWVRESSSADFIWPVRGKVISIFGTRRRGTVNKGIDIQARPGAEVYAARNGTVSFTHEGLPGFGKTIILDHGDGFASVYAYVGEILVQPGDAVAQRQAIARVGETGRTEVPALHFEIRRHQKAQNPLRYLP